MLRKSKNANARHRVVGAWATLVMDGLEPTTKAIARLSGLSPSTVGEHRMALLPYFGGDEKESDFALPEDEVKARTAVVRAAKVRHAALGGLDERTLSEILPD